ncbi:MAG TPA: beta-1,3-glucanase family protein [Streptosporangiaceae bacterium]|nr:beta-1,3-glucanase family protein [Streptosporangiaceae bacterium]
MGTSPIPPRTSASRRAFIATSLAAVGAVTVPAVARAAAGAPARPRRVPARTPATMSFDLVNNTGSDTVYAFVTGYAVNNGNALTLLLSDGHTPYYPPSPSQPLSPVGADVAIPLAAPGGTRQITVPQLAGARLWFSVGGTIEFLLNPGPALVQPSVSNPSDPNINLAWDFCEFTLNATQLFADTSCVDFVCLPIGMTLTDTLGGAQTVHGLPPGGLDTVCNGLKVQAAKDGQGWDHLIVTSGGQNLRALSPYNGMVINSSLFSGYYEPYVAQVWQKYSTTTLTIDTQESYGHVGGQVSGGQLTFPGVASFAQPSTADIFSCSSGPFNSAGLGVEALAILARLAAAFNRSTLLFAANQPNGAKPRSYYQHSPTNHYARIVHATAVGHLGYAFPYDDVTKSGGVNQSGPVSSGSPSVLTVTVGPQH